MDIIDNKTISIFNNDSFHTTNGFELINRVSSIIHYEYETKEFKKTQESWPSFPENILDEYKDKLVRPKLSPGSLYLFAGNRSLHSVTKIEKETKKTRINAIFTYNLNPNEVLNAYTRKTFFGE